MFECFVVYIDPHRSEPARSTKLSLPRVTFCVCRLVEFTTIDMIRWLRLDSRFICGTESGNV